MSIYLGKNLVSGSSNSSNVKVTHITEAGTMNANFMSHIPIQQEDLDAGITDFIFINDKVDEDLQTNKKLHYGIPYSAAIKCCRVNYMSCDKFTVRANVVNMRGDICNIEGSGSGLGDTNVVYTWQVQVTDKHVLHSSTSRGTIEYLFIIDNTNYYINVDSNYGCYRDDISLSLTSNNMKGSIKVIDKVLNGVGSDVSNFRKSAIDYVTDSRAYSPIDLISAEVNIFTLSGSTETEVCKMIYLKSYDSGGVMYPIVVSGSTDSISSDDPYICKAVLTMKVIPSDIIVGNRLQ